MRRRLPGPCGALLLAVALIAAGPAYPATFTSSAPIPIADGTGSVPPFAPGTGSPYPSTIAVSGLSGTIARLTVTLGAITHANPDDIDVMLVGPGGQASVLLSDAGETFDVSNLTLTIDDAAPAKAPDTTALTATTYQPTDRFGGLGEDTVNEFPPPAPVKSGFNDGALPLSSFNGTDPNGTWSLYLTDDVPGNTGQLAGGWSLDITMTAPPLIPTGPAILPPPELGKAVNVVPVTGQVFVSEPASTAHAAATVPGLKGRVFVPLSQARQIRVGSLLDTRRGKVRLVAARTTPGKTQNGDFIGGVFQVLQSRRAAARGLTELRLKGSSFRRCRTLGHGKRASTARHSKRRIRRLRSNARGRFRTRGRYSAATIRGTVWDTTDRCDGTLTKARRGRVSVRDFRSRKTIVLRRGKSYLARARR